MPNQVFIDDEDLYSRLGARRYLPSCWTRKKGHLEHDDEPKGSAPTHATSC